MAAVDGGPERRLVSPELNTRTDSGVRLHRLLAVLTWLARERRAPVAELAARFGMSPAHLVADLELAACCGLPPYTPDQLMEIVVDDHEVVADLGPELARPRRLTAAEGFALAASARAILAVAGSDPDGALARATAKLDAVLGASDRLRIDLGRAPHLAEVRRAAAEGRQLEVRYYSASSDEETVRVIDPLEVVAIDGTWYLDAYCHRAGDRRRFRVDRLVSIRRTGKSVESTATHRGNGPNAGPGEGADAGVFVPGPGSTVVRLAIDDGAMWLIEAVPVIETRPMDDGRTEVRLGVASAVWFDRLLLRLGTHAEVLDPPAFVDAGAKAARRVLDRYRSPE
ncbi:MAG: helix-turn-helix transcriptional regulator [Acidimicrobiales bacterium]